MHTSRYLRMLTFLHAVPVQSSSLERFSATSTSSGSCVRSSSQMLLHVRFQSFCPNRVPFADCFVWCVGYELREGLTPAHFGMSGSPGGLARIDTLFHSNGYTNTFSNSPMVFGAFPSLHAGCATADALMLSHFFPKFRIPLAIYVLWLYWSTMYLTHQ